jgi:hypothetical protein
MLIDVKVKILEIFYIIQKQIPNTNSVFSKICDRLCGLVVRVSGATRFSEK